MNVVSKLYADGRVEPVNKKWTLARMQAFVGGYIERVACTVAHRALICDEEGVLKEKSVNVEATKLVRPGTLMDQGLRGDCLLVKNYQETPMAKYEVTFMARYRIIVDAEDEDDASDNALRVLHDASTPQLCDMRVDTEEEDCRNLDEKLLDTF